jgi:hypothetical protein
MVFNVGAVCLAVVGINATLPVSLPTGIIIVLSYTISGCAGVAGNSKLIQE